ncbi:STAS domain-containing protein [Nitrosococcus wardiae]|uniref:STAS domain-containing protein n=1 Tax=Nitrosococcus wardiae TaxID=1814290 RepID=A0A4P7BV37_9GAMM|nr:STAS domain-containing protein [Nitrosococcus wardiae]QBQ53853.1 hypothetical protein E3U44_04500 [Nitrosococcus wardiae]
MSLATHLAIANSPMAGVENHMVLLTPPAVLDFALCRDFWETAQQARDSEMKVLIDLSQTCLIRDSGYTLLWMLKDSLKKGPADLLLLHCRPRLKKILQLRGFGPHFTLL